jgi:enediyne biosynthesis protein E5
MISTLPKLSIHSLQRNLFRLDARWFQITFLASLLLFGALARDFALAPSQVALAFLAGLATQVFWQHRLRLPGRHGCSAYLSACITCLGLSILVRADNYWVHPLLAGLAMSSKYLLRAGKGEVRSHILNPANAAAFTAAAGLPGAWLCPGQWGSESLAALWFLAMGGMVTRRISRLDVSTCFLFSWGFLLATRLYYLEYDFELASAMWLQQMNSGAVLLFAFFMISDPMTTPQHRFARISYGVAVAFAAFIWQWLFFKPHGLIVALFFASFVVPVINKMLPKERFRWNNSGKPLPAAYSMSISPKTSQAHLSPLSPPQNVAGAPGPAPRSTHSRP